jgi:hypothetical protein
MVNIGSGLSATGGIVQETVPGVPVAVSRFVEFDSETFTQKKHTVQGQGVRGGALVRRGSRRIEVAREAGGDISFDVPTNGLGLWLEQMLGSFGATATSIGGGLYKQVHTIGTLQGKTFTTQILKPDTAGLLTTEAFTYPGCKVTGWELDAAQNAQVKLKLTVDALDELTPANAVAGTTLASATTAGAVSISTTATIAAGSYITIGTGLTAEVLLTGTPTGSGPYTIPVTPNVAYVHASASTVGSPTGVNAGAAAGLQTASYTAGISLFGFDGGQLIVGGTTVTTSGAFVNTGGVVAANVRTVSLKGTNALKVDRWGLGQTVRSEQLENGFRDYTAAVEIEYANRYYYDIYAADAALCLQLNFTAHNGSILTFYCPVGFQDDGASPQVGGPDIITQKLAFTILDDGVNGSLQAVFTSTDSVV